ncbi:MAG: EamA family transporter [Epulopiscium sp.]|nr:EamA family transporter [Candidatus Epulonipiscium sp.]
MIQIIIAMLIWGSIGVFIQYIHLPSIETAFLRAVIASAFLFVYTVYSKKARLHKIKENIIPLVVAGIAMGFNWIFLFQAYHYTSIANSTMSYYFAPIIIILLSPLILKERLTILKIISSLGALIGLFIIMYYSSGNTVEGTNDKLGIMYGLLAAALYATVVLLSKYTKDVSGIEMTLIEIASAAVVLLPFVLMRNELHIKDMTSGIFVLIIGIVHTGIAYVIYFTGVRQINAQGAAILSYIDPLSAIVFSIALLGEPLKLPQIAGGILIFGFTLIGQISRSKK